MRLPNVHIASGASMYIVQGRIQDANSIPHVCTCDIELFVVSATYGPIAKGYAVASCQHNDANILASILRELYST